MTAMYKIFSNKKPTLFEAANLLSIDEADLDDTFGVVLIADKEYTVLVHDDALERVKPTGIVQGPYSNPEIAATPPEPLPRPRALDEQVRLKAAKQVIPLVIDWLANSYQNHEYDKIVAAVADAFARSIDGYKMCRFLEQEHGWFPNAELVDTLEGSYLWDAEREAVKEWVRLAHIEPKFDRGTVVAFRWYGGTWTGGIIDDIYRDTATYQVKMIKDGRASYVLVPFEDARPLPEDSEAQKDPEAAG